MSKRRKPKNTKPFTDLGLRRLKPPKKGQELYWDEGQRGLSLLVSPGGTKTFRSTYKLHGEWLTRSIGRFGEMVPNADPDRENVNIGEARNIVANDRALAAKGIDPKEAGQQPAAKDSYEAVVDEFITHYAKPRQRTWDQTERILKNNCSAWLKRPINDISKADARKLLRGFIADGHGPKAATTRAWLKKLWRWAYTEDLVTAPIMEAVEIEYSKKKRTRTYSDDEIKALWNAAAKLNDKDAGAYIKLMILLVPRKTALVSMLWFDIVKKKIKVTDADGRVSEQELDILVTRPDFVKQSKKVHEADDEPREYLTPLPRLALSILKGIKKQDGQDRVFVSLPLYANKKTGRPQFQRGRWLYKQLAKVGGPKFDHADYHAWRHTLATWMENEGYSKEERGLLLNHKETGVTAGYSHGYALRLKSNLLGQWADHVETVVTGSTEVKLVR